jgi:hypothetical protein
MSSGAFRITGAVLIMAGFILWAYGFIYGTFWYANEASSLFEPVRYWVSEYTRMLIKPGLVEEMLGLCISLLGMSFRVAAYLGKG